jgi:tetratricopeptide (TPR) repeat protein
MTSRHPTPLDEGFFDLLAEADDALAAGAITESAQFDHDTPEWQPRLNKDLSALRLLQRLRPIRLSSNRRLGRFEIQRELGRGGFGVVFLADDPRLGRPVALKVPRAEFLADEKLRTRFHTEARAAARLDHPNIVSVYEAGDIGPVAYIASAYCPGPTLAQWLRKRIDPIPWRVCAELAATLAEAIHYAHSQGVLHRDLKPANVLLHSTDEFEVHDLLSAVPKVTDFGLARLADADPTQSRGLLGTPSYMSPEQATGDQAELGPASDIYSLGAILYELWTGRPPFQGESGLDVLHQLEKLDPVPPARLRRGIPLDLETICCKCLEKEPRHRYATAGELADDLRRCLAGEPIRARPVGAPERVWRWCRRNRLPATLLMTIALLVPTALVIVSALYWRSESARQTADYEARRADDLATKNAVERDKAVSSYQRARAVVQRLSRLGNEIADRPGLDRAQAAVYEEVLQHCLTFLTETGDDPAIRADTARAWRQVGRVRLIFGKTQDAVDAFEHEAALLDDLLREDPDHHEWRRYRARNEIWRGHSLRQNNQPAPAALAYRNGIQLLAQLAIDAPPNDLWLLVAANAWTNLGSMLAADGSLAAADDALDHALAIQNRFVEKFKDDRSFLYDYALTLGDRALVRNRQGRYAEAEESIQQSIDVCQSLLQKCPNDPNGASYLARVRRSLAEILQSSGRLAEAETSCRDGRDSLLKLTADYPGVFDYRSALAASYNQFGQILEMQYRLDEAVVSLQQAITVQKRLSIDFPNRKDVREFLGGLHCHLARVHARLDQTANCLAQIHDALAQSPGHPTANNMLAWTLALCPEPELRNPTEALRAAELATRAAPKNGEYWNTLGATHFVMGEFRPALEALHRAESCRTKAAVDDFLLISLCHAKLGETEQSRVYFKKAESHLESYPSKDPYTARLRAEATAFQPKAD